MFDPSHLDDINLPLEIYNDLIQAWFNDNETLDPENKGMINFAKQLIMAVLIGDDIVWSQEERVKRILNVMEGNDLLPFDKGMPYNHLWMEAKKNGAKKLEEFWKGALNDPKVKEVLGQISKLASKMIAKVKEEEKFKKVSRELASQQLQLNSFKIKGFWDFVNE